MFLISKSLKQINKLINNDWSLLVRWLRSNKISLNTSKTEMLIFWPKGKSIPKHLNFRISSEKIHTSSTVKYLNLLHENLQWQTHVDSLITKLSTAVGLLYYARYYVPKYLLKGQFIFQFSALIWYTLAKSREKIRQK